MRQRQHCPDLDTAALKLDAVALLEAKLCRRMGNNEGYIEEQNTCEASADAWGGRLLDATTPARQVR